MFKALLIALLFVLPFAHADISYNYNNCLPETAAEPKIKMEDLSWGQSFKVMGDTFDKVYNSGKRLEYRAYLDGTQFVLPVKGKYLGKKQVVNLSQNFLKNVKIHIETALKRKYADYVFFSDMGHAHMFIDKKFYEDNIQDIDNYDKKAKYELMFNHKKTRYLYHTAEQLKMVGDDKLPVKDKHTQWRFFSRNIVGNNVGQKTLEVIYNPTHSHNTASKNNYDLNDSYKYWGSGFDISASKDGCFIYENKGKKFYFDISLYALNYAVNEGGY